MANPRTIEMGTVEYKRLQAAAGILTALSVKGKRYFVKDVYFDCGQDWMWITICTDGCQVLCPRDWEYIIEAANAEALGRAVDIVRSGKYFGDK